MIRIGCDNGVYGQLGMSAGLHQPRSGLDGIVDAFLKGYDADEQADTYQPRPPDNGSYERHKGVKYVGEPKGK